jgi:hypothetical protein
MSWIFSNQGMEGKAEILSAGDGFRDLDLVGLWYNKWICYECNGIDWIHKV